MVVDLITGFLGVGKTTFIKKYNAFLTTKGIKVAVIENEFGSAGIDGDILSDTVSNIRELSGGCICCSNTVNFALLLVELASEYEHVVVEPSGIFTLNAFFEVMNSPLVKECCAVGSIVTIVDEDQRKTLNETELHVLNSQLEGTGEIIFRSNQNRSLLFSDIDFEEIYNLKCHAVKRNEPPIDHSLLFNSTVIYPEHKFTDNELRASMNAIFNNCGRIFRIKGIANAKEGSYLINCTPLENDFKLLTHTCAPKLNIIGTQLKRQVIKQILFAD